MSKIEKIIEGKDAQVEHKSFAVAELKATNADLGEIEAIVSVFNNEDDGGDVVRQGFFAKSLERKLPPGVWMHIPEMTVAKSVVMKELAPGDPMLPEKLKLLGGLYVKGQFNMDTQRGREGFSDIKFGIVTEFSFAYCATKVLWDEENWTRELIEGEIFEWSPVLVGMNRETMLLSAKGGASAALTDDLAALNDGAGRIAAESARVLERVKAREALLQKQGRELSAANETMLDECAGSLEGCAQNIRALLSKVRGEEGRVPGEHKDKALPDYPLLFKQHEAELAAAMAAA